MAPRHGTRNGDRLAMQTAGPRVTLTEGLRVTRTAARRVMPTGDRRVTPTAAPRATLTDALRVTRTGGRPVVRIVGPAGRETSASQPTRAAARAARDRVTIGPETGISAS